MRKILSFFIISFVGAGVVSATDAWAQKQSRFRKGSEVRTRSNVKAKTTTVSPSKKENNFIREEGRTVVYKKRNVVDFDDALIEGEVKNPSEFYFVHRPEQQFGSLVKKRKNFHKEMLRDTVMIR